MDYEDLAFESVLFPWLDDGSLADACDDLPFDPNACDVCGQLEHADDCPEWQGGEE